MFLYFLPKFAAAALRPDQWPAALAHLAGETPQSVSVHRGPDGGPGLMVSLGSPKYLPDAQTFAPMPGGGGIWIGYATAAKPTAHDLMREEAITGHEVRLGNGEDWMVPIARLHDADGAFCPLPCTRKLAADGKWVAGDPLPPYRRLWEGASAWFDRKKAMLLALAAEGASSRTYTLDRETADAVAALAVNYRVSAAECDLLGLLDDDTVTQILDATADWRSFRLLIAKKGQAAAPAMASAA